MKEVRLHKSRAMAHCYWSKERFEIECTENWLWQDGFDVLHRVVQMRIRANVMTRDEQNVGMIDFYPP